MSQKARAAVAEARKHIGVAHLGIDYNPNKFDCSGLVQYCYKKVGVNLPRTTNDQVNCGKAVSRSNIKIGDLVFTNSRHVGLYTGNGRMIHAPKIGVPVKESNISSFYTARRVA